MKGEHIFIYQSFFEELYETLKEDIDLLVEHILAMDGKPFASMVKFIKETTLEEATADDEEEEIFEQLADDLAQINQEITEIGFIKADKVNDELSKQILLNLQQKLNMYIWRCKAYYK